jgi:hypothetical protein
MIISVFQQSGPKAKSQAMFLASVTALPCFFDSPDVFFSASEEMDSPIHHHMIKANGYNLGRLAIASHPLRFLS